MTMKKKLDKFPREIFAQHNADNSDSGRAVYLTIAEREEDVFDNGGEGDTPKPGERVGVYRFAGTVKIAKRTKCTRKKVP